MSTLTDEMQSSQLTTWLCVAGLALGAFLLVADNSALDGTDLYALLWGAWLVSAPAVGLWTLVDALQRHRARWRKVPVALALLVLWGVMVAWILRDLEALSSGWETF